MCKHGSVFPECFLVLQISDLYCFTGHIYIVYLVHFALQYNVLLFCSPCKVICYIYVLPRRISCYPILSMKSTTFFSLQTLKFNLKNAKRFDPSTLYSMHYYLAPVTFRHWKEKDPKHADTFVDVRLCVRFNRSVI